MNWILNIDNTISNFMAKTFRNIFFDATMPAITLIAEKGIILILLAIIFICIKRMRKTGLMVALAIFLSFILCNIVLKSIVARERPDILLWNPNMLFSPKDFSFPSGHTTVSFAAAVPIFYKNKKFGIAALFLAALVGFSRIYLCVHFFSDVIAGMLLGIACGIIAVLTVNLIYKHNRVY